MKNWVARKYQELCIHIGVKKSLALFLDPGLGKTTILLSIITHLLKYKKYKGALIIAPINPLILTWPEEIKGWRQFSHLKYTFIRDRPDRSILYKKRKVDLYLANPEALQWLCSELEKIPKKLWPFDILVIDESSKFKDTKSDRTKKLLKVVKKFKRAYIANGTPTGNGYIGLWSQMFIVDKGKSLGKTKTLYLDKYFTPVGRKEWGQYELKDKNTYKKILRVIKPHSVCIKAEDHINLPKQIISPKYIELPKKALDIYKDIETKLIAQIDNQDFVAENLTSKANYLHQICNGTVYYPGDPLDEYMPPMKRGFTEIHQEKIKALKDLLQEIEGQQILIGYEYAHDRETLKKHFGPKITFFNDNPDKRYTQGAWNRGKIQVLAGQINSIGFGLNLQKSNANKIIFYSVISDFEAIDQFIRRLRRSGNMKNTIFVYPILAKNLYDDKVIYERWLKREEMHLNTFEFLKKYYKKSL